MVGALGVGDWIGGRFQIFDVHEGGMSLVYVVNDQGPGFDPSTLPDPTDPSNLERIGGRGLMLIRTFMDRVEFNDSGNQITMSNRHRGNPQG